MLESTTTATQANIERYVQDRDVDITAAIRCKTYGLYSTLLASPHEVDFARKLREDKDVRELQPYGIDLEALVGTYLDVPKSSRKLEYSKLFEIGDSGPLVAIREQQQFSQVAGIREDIVRFYDFFNYPLLQRHAWAPDHLSVILEFCHLLCHHEGVSSKDRLSYQLAQLDFVSRHLLEWPPVFTDRVEAVMPESIYARVARSLCLFLADDYDWQVSTLSTMKRSGDHG